MIEGRRCSGFSDSRFVLVGSQTILFILGVYLGDLEVR